MTGDAVPFADGLHAPASELVRSWADALSLADRLAGGETPTPYLVETAQFDLPVELQVIETGNDSLMLHAASPTQKTETTILPVWHRIRFTLSVEEVADGSDS